VTELTRIVQITNKRGLHARASAKFVTLASGQSAQVEVEKDGSKVAGTSIMGLMMLGAAMGDHVTIIASGENADVALGLLVDLVENKFGED
jgi:phosphocarrier protein